MKQNDLCPKCDGTEIITDAVLLDRGGVNAPAKIYVATFRADLASSATRRHTSALSARVCVGCGYTELYATNPEYLHPPGR